MRLHLKAIDNAHGGGAALPMATWCLRTEVTPLLNGPRGDSASRSLIEIAAEFCHDGLGRLRLRPAARDRTLHERAPPRAHGREPAAPATGCSRP